MYVDQANIRYGWDSLYLIPLGAVVPCCSEYGAGTGSIAIYSVTCNGNENRPIDCDYTIYGSKNHEYDVQVKCQQGLFDILAMNTRIHCR